MGPLFYAVLELLPISVVFGVVILADISLTSGIAYSTIFVAQMLYSISFTVNGAIKEIEGFSYVDSCMECGSVLVSTFTGPDQ